jgi:hypothetical protein
MANFDAQVIELVGTTYTTDQDALNQFITEGANEVINAMPRSIMERVAEETTFTDTVSSEGHKVLAVLKHDGAIDQPCRKVPAFKRGRIQDSSDMEFASSSDPAYYIQDSLITLFPTGSGGKLVSMPTYSQSSPLDASAIATITNFPNEYEYLVVLYAAIKALQQVLNSIVLADASISYSNASVGGSITAAVDSITVAPTDAVGSAGSAYTSPSVTGDAGLTGMEAGVLKDATDQIEFDTFWDTLADMIETNEDIELASTQIAKISTYINAFQAEVQDAQAAMQATIEDARQSTQASIANAQNDVQASIQKMQLSTQASIQKMQLSTNVNITNAAKTMEALIQDYSALVTEKTNEYTWAMGQQGKLQADYDKGIQIMRGA